MGFTIHVAFHIWGHVFSDHRVFGPSFLSFLLPYHLSLRYVPCLKTTLRPWDPTSSLTASTLDRWLRSGWHLDIVMLLFLGVASLMCRTDSVVFGLPGSWVWWWLTWCHLIFLTYRTSGATLRHIPFHLEVYGSSQICTFIITYWMLTETWTWSLPYRAPEIHPASSALLDAWMSSCLSIWEDILDICARFSYGFGWLVLHVRR